MIIEVVEVNGGWTTCRDIDQGFEFKLRNGKVGEYVAPELVEEPEVESVEPAKAEYLYPAEVCPVCGSRKYSTDSEPMKVKSSMKKPIGAVTTVTSKCTLQISQNWQKTN